MTHESDTSRLKRDAAGRMKTCHGCKHCWYSAPGGQAWDRAPHSRCLHFKRNIPMILGQHEKWLGSDVPDSCPTFSAAATAKTVWNRALPG